MTSHADLIVTNARVITMDTARPATEAIAVKDGLIVAVGSAREIGALKGTATKIIDAGGCSVVPGFIEAHMHPFAGAAELDHLQLFGVHGFDALSKAVRDYAAARPDDHVLQAQGADYTILSETECHPPPSWILKTLPCCRHFHRYANGMPDRTNTCRPT